MNKYVIGADFGTDSVRSVITDTADGREIAASVCHYPRWKKGLYCDPASNQFRQHPLDYIEALTESLTSALAKAPAGVREAIVGISADTTGSTPCAADKNGTPLAMLPPFAEDPDAMFVLWKDHTSVAEADEINRVSAGWGGPDYTKYEGSVYSSEWYWAKALHISRKNEAVARHAHTWIEHCDWIPALLCGITDAGSIPRGRCAAGHKAMWHPDWNGVPPAEFLARLDPKLVPLGASYPSVTVTADRPAGTISKEWAKRLGIPNTVVVGAGAFDAHIGAVGGGIRPYWLVKVMGTSTCDIMMAPPADIGTRLIHGICGQVDGSVQPGMVGLEAGQSAFGDLYAWYRSILMWPLRQFSGNTSLLEEAADTMIARLEAEALLLPAEEAGVLSVDWQNGRRTPDANQNLKGALFNLTLGTDAPRIFRALVEGTAFGSRAITDRFRQEGVRIDGVIAVGGVARKSKLVMQTVADVLDMPIKISASDQTCALGASIFAAVAAGVYRDVPSAQAAMAAGFSAEFLPDPSRAAVYERKYRAYLRAGGFIEEQTK